MSGISVVFVDSQRALGGFLRYPNNSQQGPENYQHDSGRDVNHSWSDAADNFREPAKNY